MINIVFFGKFYQVFTRGQASYALLNITLNS